MIRIGIRNLPCDIAPENELWCVSGSRKDGNGAGVIEWCFDEEDAMMMETLLDRIGDWTDLRVHKWIEK
jgi:hypothetical protein